MSALTIPEVMAYLRTSQSSTAVDDGVLQGLLDTAEEMVAQMVGPLLSGSHSALVQGGPLFVLPTTTSAVASATNSDGVVVSSGWSIGPGGVASNSSCAYGAWTVVYTAGWSVIPAPVRTAVLELVRHLWRPQLGSMARRVEEAGPGYLIPNRVRELLAPYTMPGFA